MDDLMCKCGREVPFAESDFCNNCKAVICPECKSAYSGHCSHKCNTTRFSAIGSELKPLGKR